MKTVTRIYKMLHIITKLDNFTIFKNPAIFFLEFNTFITFNLGRYAFSVHKRNFLPAFFQTA